MTKLKINRRKRIYKPPKKDIAYIYSYPKYLTIFSKKTKAMCMAKGWDNLPF